MWIEKFEREERYNEIIKYEEKNVEKNTKSGNFIYALISNRLESNCYRPIVII